MSTSTPQKILLVRNDNVGDLVCSIPAIQLIRKTFPRATIHLLVNGYNSGAVAPLVPQWVDRLVVYQKTKHVGLTIGQLFHLARFYIGLRRQRYDTVLLLIGGMSRQAASFAHWTGARRIIGYDMGIEGLTFKNGRHEVEYSWKLASYLCGTDDLPPPRTDYPIQRTGNRIAIQITSRKPGNRWEAHRFAELGRRLAGARSDKSLLLWSPGNAVTPTHPGDDEKAAEILRLAPEAFDPRPTTTLSELIDTLKECQDLITPDGGAMHLAAAMGLRIVAMFGQSEPERWRPWTPDARVLQSPSRTIMDISVEQVMEAWQDLCR